MTIRITRKKFKRLLLVADVLLVAVLLVSLFFLARALIGYRQASRRYDAAAAAAVSTPEPTPEATPAPTAEATPAPTPEAPITVDFKALEKDTSNVVGWLYSEGTVINYPVMLGRNNEYYLTHAYDGSKSSGGSLFFDCRNARSLSDQHLILYGHHMKDGSMLTSTMRYQYMDYYEKHPVLYLITPEQAYRLEVFAARTVTSDAENFPVWFTDAEERGRYLNKAITQSVIDTGAVIRDDVSICTLVTCSYYAGFQDAKFVVHCWVVPIDA